MPTALKPGQPPKTMTPKEREIGSADLTMGGWINPDEYNVELKGSRRIKEYDKMRLGDSHVGASLKVVKLPILAANWSVQAASESRYDKRVAEHIERALFNEPTRTWQETLTNILLYLDYGVMPFEIVYKFDDEGMVTLKKLGMRHPRTITRWAMTNGENGVQQTTLDGVFDIPMDKMAIFVNEKEGDNWEGKSILRNAWKHWKFKDKAELIEMLTMQKQGLGVPRGKTPTGATTEDEAKMDELLENMRANEKGFIRHPSDWDVDFLDMKAGTVKNPENFIKRQEWAIMLNVLATFMMLGSGDTGSWALFKGGNSFFLMALEYVAKHISETINKYVIKKIVDYNFIVQEYPKLVYDKIGAVDIEALTTALQRGIQTGALVVDQGLQDYLREAMDLPEFSGESPVDEHMADDILAELDTEVANLEGGGDNAPPGAQQEDPNNPGFDMEGNPIDTAQASEEEINAVIKAWDNKTKKAEFTKEFGAEAWEVMKTFTAGAKPGHEVSDETRRKISEALKRSKSTGGGKGKKGKKSEDPAVTAKKAEIKKIKEEARQFNSQVRREMLEMKARGEKLSPEDMAKKQLDIFNRKEAISSKIAKLQGEIDDIKAKSAPKAPAAPKASEGTPDRLVDMFEAVEKELNTLKAA